MGGGGGGAGFKSPDVGRKGSVKLQIMEEGSRDFPNNPEEKSRASAIQLRMKGRVAKLPDGKCMYTKIALYGSAVCFQFQEEK